MKTPSASTLLSLLILAAAALLAACSTPSGKADDGQKWYSMHNCGKCHGENGKNGRAAALVPLDMGFGHFERVLRAPYSPSMPAFTEARLSQQDAADIYAWLKGQKEPAAK